MKRGDHVKVMGKDGFYVFLEELQGVANLRVGGKNIPSEPILAIPMRDVISLEKAEWALPGLI
jgi:hypothetical protein